MGFKAKDDKVNSGVKVSSDSTSTEGAESTAPKKERARAKPLAPRKPKSGSDATSGDAPLPKAGSVKKGADSDGTETTSLLTNKKLVMGVGAGVALVAVVGVVSLVTKPKQTDITAEAPVQQEVMQTQQTPVTPEVVPPTDDEIVQEQLNQLGIGASAVTNGAVTNINNSPVSSDTMVKDLTGKDIPEYYVVKNISYIVEFIPYTKHRATTGTGVELYWLEGTFNGQPCKLTIPYKYYRDLPDSGAVPCDVEVLQTETGELIATWFQFSASSYEQITNKK